ncbi:MAG: hypothetical protein HYZ84_01370 [Candidatus Omnitrophica bacterium]|nr:hypothetical protein [Candidatus Omnitrophota bacterium]
MTKGNLSSPQNLSTLSSPNAVVGDPALDSRQPHKGVVSPQRAGVTASSLVAAEDDISEDSSPAAIATMVAGGAGEIESLWPKIIEYVKSKRMSTGIFLSESQPVESNEGVVTLGLPSEFQFHKETLEKDSNRRLVEEAFEVVCGKKVRAQFAILKPSKTGAGTVVAEKSAADDSKVPDIIMKAMDIFGGAKIVRKE